MKYLFKILLLGLLPTTAVFAQTNADSTTAVNNQPKLITDNAKINYSVGYQIGGDFIRQGVDIDSQALVKGIQDALEKIEPLMTEQQMKTTLIDLKKKIIAQQQAEKKSTQTQYRDEGLKFLKENTKKADVITLTSGLQYKVLKAGTGKIPTKEDTVAVHYRGTLLNGTEFDSTQALDKPAQFRVDSVIAGWTEALQLMHEGDRWQLFLPPDLGYGERGPLADRTLVFDVELVKVN